MNNFWTLILRLIVVGSGFLFFWSLLKHEPFAPQSSVRTIYLVIFVLGYYIAGLRRDKHIDYSVLVRIFYIGILFSFGVFLLISWIKYTTIEKLFILVLIGNIFVNIRNGLVKSVSKDR